MRRSRQQSHFQRLNSLRKNLFVVILSEAKNLSWFEAKAREGLFARRSGLRMTAFYLFRNV
jgi:hypothetical protein